jgi:heme-degrading monooxygenase HmoA
MFAVIFEVEPKKNHFDHYLEIARVLKPELEQIDGFIDNERFASQRFEGRILSLSTWRDEKSVIRWRTLAIHHRMQEKGRFEVFVHYHLRVGEITADTHIPEGHTLQEQRFDETEAGMGKWASITEISPNAAGTPASKALAADLGLRHTDSLADHDSFESIYNPGKALLLASWRNREAADGFVPQPVETGTLRHRRVRIIRDYGMADRREAPQYYPAVLGGKDGASG